MKKTLVVLSVLFAAVIVGAVIMLRGNGQDGRIAVPAADTAPAAAPVAVVIDTKPAPPLPVTPPDQAPPAPAPQQVFTPANEISWAMDMAVSLPGTPCRPGTRLFSEVVWTNVSGKPLRVPANLGTLHIIGSRLQYIERLGPDPVIPALAQRERQGNRYRLTRANVNARRELIQPGEKIASEHNSIDLVDTTGFPAGQYRYTVEFYPFPGQQSAGAVADPAQSESVDFQVQ